MSHFDGSRLKIERAYKHIHDFDSVVGQFLSTDFYTLGVKRKDNIRHIAYYVTRIDPLPPDVPLILGDAIHNLRAALDHLMWRLVEQFCSTGPDKHTQFPITKTVEQYNSAFGKREIKEMRKDVAEVLHEIQPYSTTDDTLWDLHQLDITDKHKLIVPIACAASRIGLKAPRIWIGDLSLGFHLELAEEILNIPIDTYEKMHQHIEFGVNVTLRDTDIARGRSVLETLQSIAQYVEMVVTTIEGITGNGL